MSFNRSLNTELGEWTLIFPASLPAGANDWKRDLAREADVIVMDRADLPEVTVDRHGLHVDGLSADSATTKGDALRDARGHLALAEYLDAHPPVDEAQVEALADAIREAEKDGLAFTATLARRLVAEGWSK